MRSWAPSTVTLIVLIALAAGCRASASNEAGAQVPVTEVTDGDTLHVTYENHDERIRLIGIDTPEVPWYGGKGECFGIEAGLFVRGRLGGKSVRLAFDADRRDRYGRLLAYVYLDKELFNLTLVRLGYARADPVPPNMRLAPEFARGEAEARNAGRGLWSACRSDPHG